MESNTIPRMPISLKARKAARLAAAAAEVAAAEVFYQNLASMSVAERGPWENFKWRLSDAITRCEIARRVFEECQ
jgi:hypothetical protein